MPFNIFFSKIIISFLIENYKSPTPKTDRNTWYHGTLDRKEAEKIIKNYCTKNGTFLVRYSDRNNGSTVLTLLNEGMFFNYIIRSQVRINDYN